MNVSGRFGLLLIASRREGGVRAKLCAQRAAGGLQLRVPAALSPDTAPALAAKQPGSAGGRRGRQNAESFVLTPYIAPIQSQRDPHRIKEKFVEI